MKVLARGVDTLVINYFGKLRDGILSDLEEKKEAAKKDGAASLYMDVQNDYEGIDTPQTERDLEDFDKARASFDSANVVNNASLATAEDVASFAKDCGLPVDAPWLLKIHRFQFSVSPVSGGRMFRYLLKNGCFDLRVSAGESEESVTIQVYLHAAYLWSEGWEKAWLQARSVCKDLLVSITAEQVSRVDFCADFEVDRPFSLVDVDHFVSRPKNKEWHWKPRSVDDLAAFAKGNAFTGCSFGSGKAVRARLYDKSREIKGSDKERLITDIWGGWTDQAWRVEYQLRREALKSFKIESVHDFRAVLAGLWRYFTEWLSLRSPGQGKQKTRWKVDDRWIVVQCVVWQGEGVTRSRSYNATVRRLVGMVSGCITSIMAITGEGVESVLEKVCKAVWFDPSISRRVEEKKSRYA